MSDALTAVEIVSGLRDLYLPAQLVTEEWSLLTEVPVTVHGALRGVRVIDVLLLRNWSSGKGFERVAVEVKVSRSDFRRDTDAKRAPWRAITHRFAYATPAGLVRREELPPGCGLIEGSRGADGKVTLSWAVRGRRHAADPLPDDVIAHLARRASRAEERILRGGQLDGARLAEQVRTLDRQLSAATERAEREKHRRIAQAQLIAEVTPQTCSTCGGSLRIVMTAPRSASWAHVEAGAEAACAPLRRVKDRWDQGPLPASLADDAT